MKHSLVIFLSILSAAVVVAIGFGFAMIYRYQSQHQWRATLSTTENRESQAEYMRQVRLRNQETLARVGQHNDMYRWSYISHSIADRTSMTSPASKSRPDSSVVEIYMSLPANDAHPTPSTSQQARSWYQQYSQHPHQKQHGSNQPSAAHASHWRPTQAHT